jgi:hypothetical protein
MKAVKYLAVVLGVIFLFEACKKELSFETGLPQGEATGTLKSLSGDCQPVTVKGNYVKDSTLTDSNYVVVQISFSAPGKYKVNTDTSNGFYFQDSGYALVAGSQDITLKGTGKPILAQSTNFFVTFDSSVCTFSINVTDTVPPPIVPPVTSGDYFPTGDNSNWSYQLTTGDPTLDDTTRIAVAKTDATIAGNTYRTFISTRSAGSDTSYYRKASGLYYTYSDFNEFSIYDTVENKVEYIFLKDNVPVSSTWESPEVNATLGSVPGKAKIIFTIEGKDIKTTIGDTTLDSVIQVKQEYVFASSGSEAFEPVITANFYYAKNIGFIKAEISDPFPSTINITRWEIHY